MSKASKAEKLEALKNHKQWVNIMPKKSGNFYNEADLIKLDPLVVAPANIYVGGAIAEPIKPVKTNPEYWYTTNPAQSWHPPSNLQEAHKKIEELKESLKPLKWFDVDKLPDPGELSENLKKSTSSWWSTSNLGNKPGAASIKVPSDYIASCGPQPVVADDQTATSSAPIPKMGPWSAIGAKPIINWAQLVSRNYGYHVCLGGSVLNIGKSEKDLDLYFLPMNADSPVDPVGMKQWLNDSLGKLEPIGNSYPGKELPYIYKGKLICHFGYQPQRIDVFIMGTAAHEELLVAQAPVEVELGASKIEHFKKPEKLSLTDTTDQQIEDAIFKKYNLDPNKPLKTIKEMYPDDKLAEANFNSQSELDDIPF